MRLLRPLSWWWSMLLLLLLPLHLEILLPALLGRRKESSLGHLALPKQDLLCWRGNVFDYNNETLTMMMRVVKRTIQRLSHRLISFVGVELKVLGGEKGSDV
jgi:hypothetical protein